MIKRWAARLVEHEFWLLALSAVPPILLERGYVVPLTVGVLFWPLRKWVKGHWSVPTPTGWGMVGLLVMLVVSFRISVWPARTLASIQPVMVGILLFFAMVNWADQPRRIRLVAAGIIATGAGLAAVTLAGSRGLMAILGVPSSISIGHQNVLAGVVALLVPLPAAWLFSRDNKLGWIQRIGLFLTLVLMTGSIAVTASRGALMGVAAGLGMLILLRWTLVGGVLLIFGSAAFWMWGKQIQDWLTYRLDLGGGTWAGRVEIWLRAVLIVRDFPLTGIGMGNFPDVIQLLYPLSLDPTAHMPHAHQLFLQIAVDLGIPGLIAWLAIWIPLVVVGIKAYQRGGQLRGILAGLIGTQAVLLVHGLFDAVTWGTRPAVLVWVVWGLLMAASRAVIRKDDHA